MAKRRKTRSGTKNAKSLTKKALAKGLGISRAMLYKLIARGMPVDSVEAAKAWRAANLEPKREPGAVTSEVARLKSAQAEIAELQAAQRRGELMPFADVQRFASEAVVAVTTQLEGLPGRLSGALAGMTDPAEIRRLLLDEIRRIRAGMAQALRKLVPPDGGSGGAAAD